MYIRTNLISKDLYLVVAVTQDIHLVNNTSLNWIQINPQTVSIGDFYYNHQIISVHDAEKYNSIIAPVLHQIEEERKLINGITPPTIVVTDVESNTEFDIIDSSTPEIIQINLAKKNFIPSPTVKAIASLPHVEMNIEWYNRFRQTQNDTIVLITAIESNNWTNNTETETITFNSPIVYQNGTEQNRLTYHGSIEEHLNHLKAHSNEITIFLNQVRDSVANNGGPILH